MQAILPQAVVDMLNEQSGAISAAALPSLLPEKEMLTHCPRCGSTLGFQNLYCGGRGYVAYEVCVNFDCEYQRRAN